MLGAGAVAALLRCPSGSGFGSCLPDVGIMLGKAAAAPDLRIIAAITPAVPAAATGWSEALIAGSFDMLPAEPGRPPAAATKPPAEITGSAAARPTAEPSPQPPPPTLAAVPDTPPPPLKTAEVVPADPSLLDALERLDARISEVRAAAAPAEAGITAPVPATKPATFASRSSDVRIVGGQGVTVRSGPSTSNKRLFALAAGQKVTVKDKKRGWLHIVDARGRTGWAYSRYLRSN